MLRDPIHRGARRLPAWVLYPVGALPVIWLYAQGLTGGLGVEPVEVIEHRLGLWGLWLLLAGLCLSPLKRLGLNLLKFRRAIGLLAFFYILTHLLTWAVFDLQSLSRVWADILKRPYITIGMAGFVLLLPLAITSSNGMVRRLGALRWRRLHRLVYPALILGAVHFVMLRKGWQIEPLLYLALSLGLLLLRWPGLGRARRAARA